jgi:hypothetical protein
LHSSRFARSKKYGKYRVRDSESFEEDHWAVYKTPLILTYPLCTKLQHMAPPPPHALQPHRVHRTIGTTGTTQIVPDVRQTGDGIPCV